MPRVGLAWAGSRRNVGDRKRSIPLRLLLPLLKVPGIQFVILQKEFQEGDAGLLQRLPGVIDPSRYLGDFAATAAAVAALDLVISVDTAVAHLAGALGRKTWLLLPFSADWRWLSEREDSPWYPTMRLFRQATIGDWASVIERVCVAVAQFAKGRLDQAWETEPASCRRNATGEVPRAGEARRRSHPGPW